MSTKFVRLELSEKLLPLLKHVDVILNCVTQATEMWDSHCLTRPDFWMVWTCHDIVCGHFFFESDIHKAFNDSFVPSQLFRGTLRTTFWKTLQLRILRTWVKVRANSFIKTWVSIMKRKSTKVPWKLSLGKKIRLCEVVFFFQVIIFKAPSQYSKARNKNWLLRQ